MAYDVFISYSTRDLETAKMFSQFLSRIEGTSIFLSDSALILGSLSDALVGKIKNCDMFILLSSMNSQASHFVHEEIGVAKGNNKLIVPILLDSLAKPDSMLQGISYLSIYDEKKRNEQLPKLFQYIADESKKKSNIQALLVIGAFLVIGLALTQE